MRTRALKSAGLVVALCVGVAAAKLSFDREDDRGGASAPPRGAAGVSHSPASVSPSTDAVETGFASLSSGAVSSGTHDHHSRETNGQVAGPATLATSGRASGDADGASGAGGDALQAGPAVPRPSRAELRSLVEQANPGVGDELGLTPEEAEQFFQLLAGTRLTLAEIEAEAANSFAHDPQQDAWMARNRRAALGRQSRSLKLLLGDSRYALWQEYQDTRPARVEASRYTAALARAGMPLDGVQARMLTTAMVEEQQRMKTDVLALARNVVLEYPETQAQAQEALRRRESATREQVLGTISPYLSTQQMQALTAQMEFAVRQGREGAPGAEPDIIMHSNGN